MKRAAVLCVVVVAAGVFARPARERRPEAQVEAIEGAVRAERGRTPCGALLRRFVPRLRTEPHAGVRDSLVEAVAQSARCCETHRREATAALTDVRSHDSNPDVRANADWFLGAMEGVDR